MCDFLRQYQTLIVGGVGFAGVIVTLLTNAYLARRQHGRQVEHDRTLVRIALRAELEAVADSYMDRIQMLGESDQKSGGALLPLDTMSDVYRSMIGRIGLLTDPQVRAVLRAYLLVQQLPDRMKFLAVTDRAAEPGYVWIPANSFGPLMQMHRNYLHDVERAVAALSG